MYLPSSNPLHTIIELTELFQEFLKLASVDFLIESWNLELTLQSGFSETSNDTSQESLQYVNGLHFLNHLLLKKLEALGHSEWNDFCKCGWDTSQTPEFPHTDLQRYTRGTVIRWTQGECHVLLSSEDASQDYEEVLSSDKEIEQAIQEEEVEDEDNLCSPSTINKNTLGEKMLWKCIENSNMGNDPPNIKEDTYLNCAFKANKVSHFYSERSSLIKDGIEQIEKNTSIVSEDQGNAKTGDLSSETLCCLRKSVLDEDEISSTASNEGDPNDAVNSISSKSINNTMEAKNSQGGSFIDEISDVDENSCMLVINEDGDENCQCNSDYNSASKLVTNVKNGENELASSESSNLGFESSFKQEDKLETIKTEELQMISCTNVDSKSDINITVEKEKNNESNEDSDSDDEDDDDDSSSVTSSSSSSSSSSYSTSSSSDDDDRINFKKRVEQAAQAAREAEERVNIEAQSNISEQIFASQNCSSVNLTPSEPVANKQIRVEYGNSSYNNHFNSQMNTSTSMNKAIPSVSNIIGEILTNPHQNKSNSVSEPIESSTNLYPIGPSMNRNFDDIQAAQGLAALGKSHQFSSDDLKQENFKMTDSTNVGVKSVGNNIRVDHKKLSKNMKKLLEVQSFEIRKVCSNGFQCSICNKVFNRMGKALQHQITHTGQKPWSCDDCVRKFSSYYTLQKHIRAKHTPVHLQQFSCYICHNSFGDNSALQAHVATHLENKPFVCEICGKSFALKTTRDNHKLQHTGNRPWSCSICGHSYVTKYKLRQHIKAHSGDFFCGICNRVFASQDVFTRHKRRHDENDSISKQINRKKSPVIDSFSRQLKNSLLSKGGSIGDSGSGQIHGSFKCQMCHKTFEKSSDLTHHLTSCCNIGYCPPLPSTPILTTNHNNNKQMNEILGTPCEQQINSVCHVKSTLTNQHISKQGLNRSSNMIHPTPISTPLPPNCVLVGKKISSFSEECTSSSGATLDILYSTTHSSLSSVPLNTD